MSSLLPALAAGVAGIAAGLAIRWGSIRLARHEELEPGHRAWQVYGPPAACGLLFFVSVLLGGSSLNSLLDLVWIAVLVQVFFFDFEHLLILDWVILPAILLALVASFFDGLGIVVSAVSGLLLGGFFWAVSIIGGAAYKTEALGLGDVKLAAFIGCVLGLMPLDFPAGRAILYGLVAATLVAVPMTITGRLGRREVFPLGPFLALGALVVLLG